MATTGVAFWSQTAATNATADSSVGWAEGQAPSTVNDSARAMMASTAKWRDDLAGALTTGGTSVAYTLTTNQAFPSLTALSGQALRVKFSATNGAAATLNVDGLNAKALVTVTGAAVGAGKIKANAVYDVVYANGSSEFILVNGTGVDAAFPAGTAIVFYQASAPTGWTKSSANNDKALRVVSGSGGVAGGTTAFGSVFAARTIVRGNLPQLDFMAEGAGNIPIIVDTGSGGAATTRKLYTNVTTLAGTGASINIPSDTGAVPSVGGHIYLNGNVVQTALDFAVQYIDCIVCTKD